MGAVDLQIADAMKRISQCENNTIQKQDISLIDGEKTKTENKVFEIYIEQIKKNRVNVNKRNYNYQSYNFLDNKITIPLRQNDFMPLMTKNFTEKRNQTILYNRDGCFLNLEFSKEPSLYKSLIFFKHQVTAYYKSINTSINWIKIARTENLKYGIYKTISNETTLFVITFTGEHSEYGVLNGNFTCTDDMHNLWMDIFEASLHLLKIN